MLIDLTKSHYGSLSQNIPEVKLSNLYIADNPLSPTGYSYVARPTLTTGFDLTGASVRGLYYQQGFLPNDELLVVIDNKLYRMDDTGTTTLLGQVDGSGPCRFASTIFYIAILSGSFLYLYDGSSLTPVAIPDDGLPTDITSFLNYIVMSIENSNKFFWINPGELVIDPLSFASAEANPDSIVSVQSTSDELWLIGATSTEVWSSTGDKDAPFVRISGRIFNLGCVSYLSVCEGITNSLPSLFWITDNKEVIYAQGAPNKISNEYVEEVLRASTTFLSWFFRRNRNDFYVITTDIATLVYDINHGTWAKWNTYSKNTWDASFGVQKNETLFAVNLDKDSTVWKLSNGAKDGVTEWLVCEVTGFVPNATKSVVACNIITLTANPGFGSSYLTNPVIELRWSDDQGANWSPYMQSSLGSRGVTESQVTFRSLGQIKQPGRRFEIRFSGVEDFRLDYASMNWD